MRVLVRRRLALIGLITGVAIAVVGLTPAGWAAGRPARGLTLVRSSPVTVSGTGFAARSRVTVTLSLARTFTRHPLTDGHGGFGVSFPARIDPCTAWSVSAVQRGGTLVVLRARKPLPECAPASMP